MIILSTSLNFVINKPTYKFYLLIFKVVRLSYTTCHLKSGENSVNKATLPNLNWYHNCYKKLTLKKLFCCPYLHDDLFLLSFFGFLVDFLFFNVVEIIMVWTYLTTKKIKIRLSITDSSFIIRHHITDLRIINFAFSLNKTKIYNFFLTVRKIEFRNFNFVILF